MNDLIDSVLVEVLCRLPCYKSVCQCKCVSKRWSNLLSNSYLIRRFIGLKRDRNKQASETSTLISGTGVEFLRRINSSTDKPLTHLFNKMMSYHGLEKEPIVEGTYNDLVLCCATRFYQRDYYICNPYTFQWVALPPPPYYKCKNVAVGFICDLPYYYSSSSYNKSDDLVQLNEGYRCRVVRIVAPIGGLNSKFRVQVFSSETGKWTELIVSTPSVGLRGGKIHPDDYFTCNRMVYWPSWGPNFVTHLIGLDPFMISDINNSSTSSKYCCRFVRLGEGIDVTYLGVKGGCVRMKCDQDAIKNIHAWDLNEVEDSVKGNDGSAGGASTTGGELICLGNKRIDVCSLDIEMLLRVHEKASLIIFDPSDDDIVYASVGLEFAKCNIRKGEWSTSIAQNFEECEWYYPIVIPWWPTPLPRIPQHAAAP